MNLYRIAFLATVAAAIGVVSASSTTKDEDSVVASSSSEEALDELLETVKASVESNIGSLHIDYNFGGDQSSAMAAMAAATSLARKYSAFNGMNVELDASGFPSDGRNLKGATIQSFAPLDSLYNRKCGEVIDVVTDPAVVTNAVNTMIGTMDFIFAQPALVGSTYDNYFGPAEAATNRSKYSFVAENGIKAVKVCAKCANFKRMVKPEYQDKYAEICEGYGADGTVSALALIPIKKNGRILRGALEGAITYRGIQSFTYDAPSSKWPSSGLAGTPPDNSFFRETDYLQTMMIAGSGKVAVMPDGIGFGESGSCFKGAYIKELYKAATVPVYLATKQYIGKDTNCRSELTDTLAVSAYSEGGYASVVIADVLTSLGFSVTNINAGSLAHNVMTFVSAASGQIISDTVSLQFAWAVPIAIATFSSTVPGIANYGDLDQSLSNREGRLRLIQFVVASLFIPDLRALTIFTFGFTGTGAGEVTTFLNPEVEKVVGEGGTICNNEKLDKLCLALSQNNVAQMVMDAPVPVSLCHSPYDELIPFLSQYPDGMPLPNSEFLISDFGTLTPPASGVPANNFYGHGASKANCDLAYAFDVIDTESPSLSMSGQCKRRGKRGN